MVLHEVVDGSGGWVAATAAGVAAGLGVAVPLGAVGVLVVQESLTRGRAHGLAAAAGVALTDLLYAVVAVVAGGAAAAWIAPHEQVVRRLAAAVLLAVAGWGIRRAWRSRRGAVLDPTPDGRARAAPNGCARAVATAARFAAVTLVNPATVVAFGIVVAGLGGALGSGAERTGFAVGVLAGSAGWHVLLALTAARLGPRMSTGVRAGTAYVGHGVVLLLAVGLALPG